MKDGRDLCGSLPRGSLGAIWRLLAAGLAATGFAVALASAAGADPGGITLTIPVTLPTENLQIAAPGSVAAGSPLAVIVTAADRNANATPGYRGTVHFMSSDPGATLPADYTFTSGSGADNGTHTFDVTLKTAGPQTITASDTANSSINGTAFVTVNSGPAASFRLNAPSPVMQGSPFMLRVTALDAFGNVATGYAGLVQFASSDARSLLPPGSTLTAGQGSFPVTLRTAGSQTISASDSANASSTGSVAVSVIALPLSLIGQAITTTEGASFTSTIATFTDPVVADPAGSYAATITWGDGTPVSAGTVSALGSGFLVSGTHTYAEEGSYSLTIVLVDADGSSGLSTSSASVTDAALTASPTALSAAEGAPFSGVVTHFTDADPGRRASDYAATINWGDGQPPGTDTIVASGNGFDVTATHAYAEEGSYAVSVVVTDAGSSFIRVQSTAVVADAALIAHAIPITATEGIGFSGPVASFTDSGSVEPATNYSAVVTWGAGSSSAGTITVSGSTITVSATHTYQEEAASVPVAVVLADDGGSNATASSTAQVADAALMMTPGKPVAATVNGPTTAMVATFTDKDPNGVVGDYAATIDWGDHSTSAGTVAAVGTGFSITGTHAYTAIGSDTITVSIRDAGGSTASATLTALVTNNVCTLYDQTRSVKSGATIPIKLELCDGSGANLSSASIVVTATALLQLSTNTSGLPEASGNANPDNNFRFDSTLGTGGGYIYNLSTRGLPTGTYALTFTVSGDPIAHSVQFRVR